jgi:hypothetical protein
MVCKIIRLTDLMAQRDREISILVSKLKKEKELRLSSTAAAPAALPAKISVCMWCFVHA